MRGRASTVGDTRVAQNGYEYTRTEAGWMLTHHYIAAQLLGRPVAPDELVRFKDKDRKNLNPNNIEVIPKKRGSVVRRKAQIEARIAELQAELQSLSEV
jgi:hypothetical protein